MLASQVLMKLDILSTLLIQYALRPNTQQKQIVSNC